MNCLFNVLTFSRTARTEMTYRVAEETSPAGTLSNVAPVPI